jgi:2-oxoglutarate dehydrogenase E2 component (dihydrolipoamide succinyltransferase)
MEIRVPDLGESITEGTIAKWIVSVGAAVHPGDVLVEIETDKVNLEIQAEEAGTVREILKQEGDTVGIGEVIAVLGETAGAAAEPGAEAPSPAAEAKASPAENAPAAAGKEAARPAPASEGAGPSRPAIPAEPLATPAARRYAREHGRDLRQIVPRDPKGRVGVFDLKGQAGSATEPQAEPPSAPMAVGAAAGGAGFGKPVEVIRMSRLRQTIASRLVEVQHNAAMLTTFNEIDMTAVMDLRKRRQEAFVKKHGVKLGFMSFFTKAVIGALKDYPFLNAEIRGNEIHVKKYYDIGIAVSTEEGLVVPVVRTADRLSFGELEAEIADLAEKARSRRLKISDLEGGTFTITNGGVFGSLMSTPILNPPQVGILGMHKIMKRPVAVDDDRMENRPMMYVALSYDHRVVDGREAVGFLVRVKELLEDPESMMFDV